MTHEMSMEFYSETWRTARKSHKCEACGETIKPGEKYRYMVGIFDGDFFTRAWDFECGAVMDYYFDFLTTESEFDYTGVHDDIAGKFCSECPHGPNNEDDCPHNNDIWHCPLIQKRIIEEYGEKYFKEEAE